MDSSKKFAPKMIFFLVLVVVASELCIESEAQGLWGCIIDSDCKPGCKCIFASKDRTLRYCKCPGLPISEEHIGSAASLWRCLIDTDCKPGCKCLASKDGTVRYCDCPG